MEDALRERLPEDKVISRACLNPCSNGRCSARRSTDHRRHYRNYVLILVLMEDALRGPNNSHMQGVCESLNPCSNGRCSASAWLTSDDQEQ